MIVLRDLASAELPRARTLLASCDLPTDDLADPAIALVGAFDGGALVGVIGLQACGDAALLRSLAVEPAHRDRGVARALCERVYEMAGRRHIWLLTTTAESYFARAGFAVMPRDAAPPEIAASQQFTSLCPASARLMRRA